MSGPVNPPATVGILPHLPALSHWRDAAHMKIEVPSVFSLLFGTGVRRH
jgi:hypothetical protein